MKQPRGINEALSAPNRDELDGSAWWAVAFAPVVLLAIAIRWVVRAGQ